MASSCRSATRSTAIARRAHAAAEARWNARHHRLLPAADGATTRSTVPACGCTGRRPPNRYLEGREVVVFSPHLNDRDFRVSFAPEYRLFTTWEALERAPATPSILVPSSVGGVPDGTSSDPELNCVLSAIREALCSTSRSLCSALRAALAAPRAHCAAHQG